MHQKLAEIKQERGEHELVADSLRKAEPERKAWRLVGEFFCRPIKNEYFNWPIKAASWPSAPLARSCPRWRSKLRICPPWLKPWRSRWTLRFFIYFNLLILNNLLIGKRNHRLSREASNPGPGPGQGWTPRWCRWRPCRCFGAIIRSLKPFEIRVWTNYNFSY